MDISKLRNSWLNPRTWTFSSWFLLGLFCFLFAITAFGTLIPAMQEILQFKLHLVFASFFVTIMLPGILGAFLHAFIVQRFALGKNLRSLLILLVVAVVYGLSSTINVFSSYDTLVGRSLMVLDCVSRFKPLRCQERMNNGERYFSLLLPEAQEAILNNMTNNSMQDASSVDGSLFDDVGVEEKKTQNNSPTSKAPSRPHP